MALALQRLPQNSRVIFDVLYGFIPITEWEAAIIDSPFFQRLRWIKQLGFANYIFPGAEHNRFAHALGVMHSMDQMIHALGLAVPAHDLFDRRARTPQAMLHKCLRIAALLHDIGTFPFSHSIENAYIRHGNDSRTSKRSERGMAPKNLQNSHEHLGSFIIKNTDYEGGLTRILTEFGFEVQFISDIIKGTSPYLVANQLMHSDLDADRMDYLMRDSYYTGMKYGQFDRDYLLANIVTYDAGRGQVAMGVKESALHAVEDFLFSRFSWYSQVIKNRDSAKFDILSTHVAQELLKHDALFQFHDLLSMISARDERFFWFNDIYFMSRCQQIRAKRKIRDHKVQEQIEMLLFRKKPRTLKHPLLEPRFLRDIDGSGAANEREREIAKIKKFLEECERILSRFGNGREWILADIPRKDVVFASGMKSILKKRKSENIHFERDPIRIVSKSGTPTLLAERENSLMKNLGGLQNFIPSIYANDPALELIIEKGPKF